MGRRRYTGLMRIDIPVSAKGLVQSPPGLLTLDTRLRDLVLKAPADLVGVPNWITVLCDEETARALLTFFESCRDLLAGATNDQRAIARITSEHFRHELRLARIDFV